MATSYRTFLIQLYEEYLEEASALYEQRRTLYTNPEITWREVAEFENRLEAHVVDPSNEQSATAVLDKIGGAVLIGARQRQARLQMLTGVVEQLLIDSKRNRDSEAASINMQLVTWRDARHANHAFGAGTGDALRTWRQP